MKNQYKFKPEHANVPLPDGYILTKQKDDSFKLEIPEYAYDLANEAERYQKQYIDLGDDKYDVVYQNNEASQSLDKYLSFNHTMKIKASFTSRSFSDIESEEFESLFNESPNNKCKQNFYES